MILYATLCFCLVCMSTMTPTTTTYAASPNNHHHDRHHLYTILGVTTTATSREIKSAYRRKALDTHPDKNKAVSPEQAAEAFRQVVQAFEVLSDPERRQYYDATGRTEEEAQQQQQQHGYGGGYQYQQQQQQQAYHWHFHWHNHHAEHQTHLRDTWEAQNAQSRMMHITSLEQFRTLMLDDDEHQRNLERHFVLCIVKPGPMEATALRDMVFPYPFAGMSEQNIWWEDILQTMYVSLTEHTAPLAQFFGISLDDDMQWDKPIFVYGKAGSPFENGTQFPRIHTANRDEMETFVWDQLQAKIEFVNKHSHSVELFWMDDEDPILALEELAPGASVTFTTSLSQVWFARDKRVDNFKHPQERYYSFSDESVLMAFHVLQESQVFTIPQRTCFDLATDCEDWAEYGECMRQPAQMAKLCPYSCDHCEEEEIIYHLYPGHQEL